VVERAQVRGLAQAATLLPGRKFRLEVEEAVDDLGRVDVRVVGKPFGC
jgi:hypothetical protein